MSAPSSSSKAFSIAEFIVIFFLIYFITNAVMNRFFPSENNQNKEPPMMISMEASSIRILGDPVVLLRNTTDQDITLPDTCPAPAVTFSLISRGTDGVEKSEEVVPNNGVLPCVPVTTLPKKSTIKIPLNNWKYALFKEPGEYRISLDIPEGVAFDGERTLSTTLRITDIGFFTKIFRTFISRPLLNSLIFIGTVVPGHSLALAIILLTILTKLLLLVPNQHALKSQKKMQELQPKMDELKKKYGSDGKKLHEETMKLWKEMNINPLESCLPTFLQLPILIGLFFVIRDGVHIATSRHLLYSFFTELPNDFFVHTLFGFDLLAPEKILCPILLVLLQFMQMKMMMAKKKPSKEIVVKPQGKTSFVDSLDQQTIMLYVMPLMIGYFALQFPLAVSLYWGVSTVFGIVQQWYVMKKD